MRLITFLLTLCGLLISAAPSFALDTAAAHGASPVMVDHPGAAFCLIVFVLSYIAVLFEERTQLRKSKPVMLGAGIIWVTVAMIAPDFGVTHDQLRTAVFHGLDEYASLLLFLLAAMTYISALQERQVFAALRSRLVQAGLNMRQLFWVTGVLSFLLSPVADNMTTALVMGAVVMAVGANDPKFVALACINIVNAANAGGAFSPFGDITTLMVWQSGKIPFFDFFPLFVPSLVCFLVPAVAMSGFIAKHRPLALGEAVSMKRGARAIIALGFVTIVMAVSLEQFLGLPPFIGMMMGMSLLMIAAFVIQHIGENKDREFDILDLVKSAEWDTLLFFFGVIFSVGGLSYLGWLDVASSVLYDDYGPHIANISMGFASAVIDNIPVMYAILSMDPEMNEFQWLLITLTTGIGGSLLSIGSAAGVALMGVARGQYTFAKHLRWTPVILLGYIAAVAIHYWLNG